MQVKDSTGISAPLTYGQETGKKEQVIRMFDSIAWRYDFLNHFFSFRIDKIWRRKAANELRGRQHGEVLDVATGTADLALTLQKRLNPQHITGIDISEGMLALGRKKIAQKGMDEKISLLRADSEEMPFGDNTFDAIMAGFGVRNFDSPEKGLNEMFRVLKPGGKTVILEFSVPDNKIFRKFYYFYFFHILPLFGNFISKDAHAYSYLPGSVRVFPHGANFIKIMENCGFTDVRVRPLSFGIASIYTGIKS
jgi:demethylmenaquinone methyltransferase/2-methoxy-6-polyprenyl-1,4-benzoquinol methylase